jgi:hypothetical protein
MRIGWWVNSAQSHLHRPRLERKRRQRGPLPVQQVHPLDHRAVAVAVRSLRSEDSNVENGSMAMHLPASADSARARR